MGRHPFSGLKSSKGCDEAVSVLSSNTFLTQYWENTAYTLPPSVSGVGVWVRWRWDCVSCKAWIMQTLKKACSALPRALELSSLSSYVTVITASCPITISCRCLFLPFGSCTHSELCPPFTRAWILRNSKATLQDSESITCMNQVIISSSVFWAQFCWQDKAGSLGPLEGPCCFSLLGWEPHSSPNAPAFMQVLHFRRKRLHYGIQLCFCMKHFVFIFSLASSPKVRARRKQPLFCFWSYRRIY